MLAVAFENWIRHVSERGFDESFICLLRANGFFDIRFRHGTFEFGKDFTAKRREEGAVVQYAFQSKAGDIDGAEWSKLYGQLDELSGGRLAPTGFDPNLPRHSILVTTGRLLGKVPLVAKDFGSRVQARGDGAFDTWEFEQLLEMVQGVTPFPIGPTPALAQIAAQILASPLSDLDLEIRLAQFATAAAQGGERLYRALVDNFICGSLLAEQKRPLQQLTAALNGVRLAAVRAHVDKAEGRDLLRAALDSYVAQGESCLAELLSAPADRSRWLAWCECVFGHIVAYPVLCLRVLEFLGIALLAEPDADQARSARFLDCCKQIVRNQPGVHHPISDRLAASLAPAVIALYRNGESELCRAFLRATAKWVLDQYERSEAGLAGPYATPADEVRTFLGAPFEAVELAPRRESLLAVVLADLAYYVAPTLYPDIVNDITAVGIFPTSLHADDVAGAYVVAVADATRPLVNIAYPAAASATRLPHHTMQSEPRLPERLAGPAAVLALACLVRDRLFSDCYPRALLAPG